MEKRTKICFILKDLNENLKFSRYENSFLWLKNAGVALPTYNVEEPVVPLKLSRSRNLFKLFQRMMIFSCFFMRVKKYNVYI